MTRRPAIYARISTNEGRQHLDNQLAVCRQYAAAYKDHATTCEITWLACAHIYTDIESGGVAKRPGLASMLADARHGKFDVLLVFRLDRLTREGPGRAFELIRKLSDCGVDFVSATEPMFRTNGPAGDLLIAIAAYIAGEERRAIRERVKAGLARAKAKGVTLGRPTADVDAMELLRMRREGYSLAQIARELGSSKSTVERKLRKLKG
jgi:DNA invertase Pin-like site-specific DNA recombinase